MARLQVKEGTRVWVWSGKGYVPGTVAAVRSGIAVVTSQRGADRIAVGSLVLTEPKGKAS